MQSFNAEWYTCLYFTSNVGVESLENLVSLSCRKHSLMYQSRIMITRTMQVVALTTQTCLEKLMLLHGIFCCY